MNEQQNTQTQHEWIKKQTNINHIAITKLNTAQLLDLLSGSSDDLVDILQQPVDDSTGFTPIHSGKETKRERERKREEREKEREKERRKRERAREKERNELK